MKKAVELDPETVRFAYVLGIALNSTGSAEEGIAALESAHNRRPGDRNILNALATINRDAGHKEAALAWAKKLLQLNPADAGAQQLLQSLNP